MAKLRKSDNIAVDTIRESNNIALNALIKADKVTNVLRELVAINVLNVAEVD